MKVRFFSLSLLAMAAHLLPSTLLTSGANALDLDQLEDVRAMESYLGQLEKTNQFG